MSIFHPHSHLSTPQSRGADPSILSEDFDPYLSPGAKLPVEVATEEGEIRSKLLALEKKYASVAKAPLPHPDIGCWWTIYDYGLDRVKTWAPEYKHPYPGMLRGWWGYESVLWVV